MSGRIDLNKIMKQIAKEAKTNPWEPLKARPHATQTLQEAKELRQKQKFASIGLPTDQLDKYTFSTFKAENLTPHCKMTFEMVKKWTPENKFGVILAGPTGVGKTHLLRALQVKWHSGTYPTRFFNWARFMDDLRGDYESKNDKIDYILNSKLIVIDEIGAGKKSEFSDDILYKIVNTALETDIKIFGTTNYNSETFEKLFDTRVIDRLKSTAPIVAFTNDGKSFRAKQHENNLKQIHTMRRGYHHEGNQFT